MLDDNLRTVYIELCNSYRAIDDFRAKLLGFLPLVTSGIFLLSDHPKTAEPIRLLLPQIGIFGFAIALGLFFFELYGIRKCTALINTGKELEKQLGCVIEGQFFTRPDPILGFIDERIASATIYSAVLAAWAYLACLDSAYAYCMAILVFIVGLLFSYLCIHKCNS